MLINIVVVQLNMIGVLRILGGTTFFANRTASSNGDRIRLSYTAGHVGDNRNFYPKPSSLWVINGEQRAPSIITGEINGQLSVTLFFTFQESDAGVYQCIFFGAGSEIYGTTPLRLDTG